MTNTEMGRHKPYFIDDPGAPAPLAANCERQVRFEEVDLMGLVWHGRYSSYLEDGRIAFGNRYGLSYQEFVRNQTAAPIVQLHLDFQTPLRFGDWFTIQAQLHWSEALRLNFSYRLTRRDGAVAATGYSVQLLTDIAGSLLLVPPPWIAGFRDRWRSGEWRP